MTGDAYEALVKEVKFTQPEEISSVCGPGKPADLDPATAECLDYGAGTGLTGLKLKEKGFQNITGIDGSESLLEKLNQCGAYKASRCLWLGVGADKYPDDLKGKFDLVTATGVFLKGHVPALGYEDVYATLKTGGYLVAGTRSMYWKDGEAEGFKDKVDAMIAEGKFKKVHEHEYTHGVEGAPEDSFQRQMQTTCYVLQKQ